MNEIDLQQDGLIVTLWLLLEGTWNSGIAGKALIIGVGVGLFYYKLLPTILKYWDRDRQRKALARATIADRLATEKNARLASDAERYKALQKRADEASSALLARLSAQVETLQSERAQLSKRVDALTEKMGSLSEHATRCDTQLEEMRSRYVQVQNENRAMSERLNGYKNALSDLRSSSMAVEMTTGRS